MPKPVEKKTTVRVGWEDTVTMNAGEVLTITTTKNGVVTPLLEYTVETGMKLKAVVSVSGIAI